MYDNLPSTAAGTLNLLANTQTEIDHFSDSVIKSVKDGEVSPLKVLIQLRAMEKASKRILSEIKENYMNSADNYPGKDFEFLGNKIEKAELGTEYDFTVCGDPTYERLEVDFNTAKKNLDDRKAFLKTIKVPTPIGDTVTGELVTVMPPKKTSESGLKVTIR